MVLIYHQKCIYAFNSCLDNNEDNFENFDINHNNETEPDYIFDEKLVNFDQLDGIEVINDDFKTIESTETYLINHINQICNDLYCVMNNSKEISTFDVGILLEIKEIIMSKQNKNLDLNRLIIFFSNFKNTFTPLEKKSNDINRTVIVFFTRKYEKEKK